MLEEAATVKEIIITRSCQGWSRIKGRVTPGKPHPHELQTWDRKMSKVFSASKRQQTKAASDIVQGVEVASQASSWAWQSYPCGNDGSVMGSRLFFHSFRESPRPDNVWDRLCMGFLRGHCMNMWKWIFSCIGNLKILEIQLMDVWQGELPRRNRANPRMRDVYSKKQTWSIRAI